MTALQLAKENYNNFSDKMEITHLINSIHRIEAEQVNRNSEGDKENGFKKDTFEKVSETLRAFLSSRRNSQKIKNLCISIVSKMNY